MLLAAAKMQGMKRLSIVGLSVACALGLFIGCGTDNGDSETGNGGSAGSGGGSSGSGGSKTGGSGGGSSGSSGEAGSSGGTSGGASGGAGWPTGGSGGGTSGSGGAIVDSSVPDVDFTYDAPLYEGGDACATASVEAQLKPLDLYIMADRSGSMSGSLWNNQSNALKAFFNDPQSANITVALRFFPLDDSCSPQDGSCSGNAYQNPLVPWGVLPGHAGTLSSAIDGTSPNGCFTPTQEALNGVLKGAYARQVAEPGHVVVAVIVSDGQPCCSDCPMESTDLGSIAASYLAGSPSVQTFSIFVASAASAVMTAIAQQGGTGQAFNATSGAQAFIDALKAIQGSAIPCEFAMPTTSSGTIDPDQVSLDYYAGGSSTPTTIPRVPDAGSCGGGGWYYDNPINPTKLILCPSTCDQMKADPGAKVSIELGCLGS